jgi:hypothetical protein
MTMHLIGPWMTTTGKKKGKAKWRSAEQKRQAEQLDLEWKKLVDKHQIKATGKVIGKSINSSTSNSIYRSTNHIPSKPDSVVGAVTIKQTPKYTGDKIIGIGTMHKSNAVPIFNDKEAKDISTMRRN